ncbi:MAG TPA: 16S rRNA (guanine(966)-N(2))-methyltransferase RsmD [Thermoleophilia bacterium]|nr:16S rRNA (guanine(966)-N(2))-methyltransferase RsmD [Thermoleophilia bacterium]
MRVVGGAWRGRPLQAPPGRGTRPTSDKVREAMFDVLGALPEARRELAGRGPLAGHEALDVFAGSGALGIEALSRGADACTFVESAAPALRALRGNLVRVGVPIVRAEDPPGAPGEPRAVVLAGDVRRTLAADARSGTRYTLVFADPPYDEYEQVRPVLVRLLERVLVPGAVLVVESAAGTAAGLPWTVVREKRYGDTQVTFLVAEAPPPAEGEAAS